MEYCNYIVKFLQCYKFELYAWFQCFIIKRDYFRTSLERMLEFLNELSRENESPKSRSCKFISDDTVEDRMARNEPRTMINRLWMRRVICQSVTHTVAVCATIRDARRALIMFIAPSLIAARIRFVMIVDETNSDGVSVIGHRLPNL